MIKLKLLALFIAFVSSGTLLAQSEKGCGFLDAQNAARKFFPDYDKNLKKLEEQNFVIQGKQSAATLTIPVVFHILHLNGSENISDAQIQSAMSILNQDFRKLNSDTSQIVSQFKSLAADCNIEFKLANRDPDGKCTNGITRHYDAKTNWTVDPSYYVYTWPPSKYLNVYVVKTMQSGAAGYTYLPGTVPPSIDAIVILHNYVGKIGTGNNFGSRSLTHEVGHWLGLSHIWGNTNNPGVACGDDGVSDTPITKGHSNCNLANAISCTPNVVENIQNYMEYSFCSRMYTIGQSNRMNGILASTVADRNILVSASNMTATGIVNPNYNCAPKADFVSMVPFACESNTIAFTDHSYNGTVNNWFWSSPAAQNTSTLQNGILTFTASGLQPVKLKVGNGNGNDSTTKVNYVTVLASNGASVNVAQGFENGTYPNDQWIASIPQYGGTFVQTATVGANSSKCMYVNNYLDNPNQPINLYSPLYNLGTVTGAQLTFKYAYAQQSGNNDMLRIYATGNCGTTWNMIYNQSGSNLATAPSNGSQAFMNPSASEWKSEMISMSPYQGQSAVYVRFEFTSDPSGPGNNFFIDDINLSGVVGLNEIQSNLKQCELFPNPTSNWFTIRSGNTPIERIELMDMTGKTIRTVENVNANEFQFETVSMIEGMYFVKVLVNGKSEFYKLIIE